MYTVPVVNCNRSDSCVECVDFYPNPLCGWCTLEHKCSRQSQCQNSHLAKRYIKERGQCITVNDIHPRQITVGNSNTVSIHDTGLLIAHIISNFCSVSCTDDWLYVCVYSNFSSGAFNVQELALCMFVVPARCNIVLLPFSSSDQLQSEE